MFARMISASSPRVRWREEFKDRFFLGKPTDFEKEIQQGAMMARVLLLEKLCTTQPWPKQPRIRNGKSIFPADLELLKFGHWLLVDAAPGARPRKGPQPDLRVVWRAVVAMAVSRKLLRSRDVSRKPSRREISQVWQALFEEYVPADTISGRIPTARHFVGEFLRCTQLKRPDHAFRLLTDLLVIFGDKPAARRAAR